MSDEYGSGAEPEEESDPRANYRALVSNHLAKLGEKYEDYEAQRRAVDDYLETLGPRGRGDRRGHYPGATVPNEPRDDFDEPYPRNMREFGILKDLRRLTMDHTIEALRGVQRLKDAQDARGWGHFGFQGRASDSERPSTGLGDVLFELGAAHVRTWQRLLKVTTAYGDSWMPAPGSGRVAVGGWEVVTLTQRRRERGWRGVFALRNASPMKVSIAWPDEAEFVLRDDDGEEVDRASARLDFRPPRETLDPYEMDESIVVHAYIDATREEPLGPGRWSASTAVRLADLVDLALTLRIEIAPPAEDDDDADVGEDEESAA